jgi:Zn-dependent protease with chaperone function
MIFARGVGRAGCDWLIAAPIPLMLMLVLIGCGGETSTAVPTPKATAGISKAPTIPLRRKPASLSLFDFAPAALHLYADFLESRVEGSAPSAWKLYGLVRPILGSVEKYLDGERITEAVNEALSTDGQPFGKLNRLVDECVSILHVARPDVRIRNSPAARITWVRAGEHEFLVVTSAMLELFEDRQEELQFLIGRELARAKGIDGRVARHVGPFVATLRRVPFEEIAAWTAPSGLFSPAKQTISQGVDALKRAIAWCREAEFAMDRAGLLCCQDARTAYNALARLMSGMKPNSKWIDPDAKDFNIEAILAKFEEARTTPELLSYVAESGRDGAPFIPDRIANLRRWVDGGGYDAALAGTPRGKARVKLSSAKVFGMKEIDCDPFLVVRDGAIELLRTPWVAAAEFKAAGGGATWSELDTATGFTPGKPLLFEIWDRNAYTANARIGGFAVFVSPDKTLYSESIRWDLFGPPQFSEAASAEVEISFADEE